MSPGLVIIVLVGYFLSLLIISALTSRAATTETFFTANRQSRWYLVAFGMIGTSLSGVTFISVPGSVGQTGFSYFQVVLGYWVGYWVIMGVLMPLFYRLELTSIYAYLGLRFGPYARRTGSFFFLLSRTIGAAFRLFLAATVLHIFLFKAWHFPFYATVVITVCFIWVYTFRGGIKTIIWTDTFQTAFLILAVVASVVVIADRLDLSLGSLVRTIREGPYAQIFYLDDPNSTLFFPKQFVGGMFIAIAMTGLDQDMMQKNLTCRTLKEAQKNMFWFSATLVLINLLFLALGALLYTYSAHYGIAIPLSSDELFPQLALREFGTLAGILFLLGIIASAYSSSDSALAALTTAFCIDFLDFQNKDETTKQRQKNRVHLGVSALLIVVILVFQALNKSSVIHAVLTVAGYTYGPLLGLFAFGLFTQRSVKEKWIPAICVVSPLFSYALVTGSKDMFEGYQIGIEALPINGLITCLGLWIASKGPSQTTKRV